MRYAYAYHTLDSLDIRLMKLRYPYVLKILTLLICFLYVCKILSSKALVLIFEMCAYTCNSFSEKCKRLLKVVCDTHVIVRLDLRIYL